MKTEQVPVKTELQSVVSRVGTSENQLSCIEGPYETRTTAMEHDRKALAGVTYEVTMDHTLIQNNFESNELHRPILPSETVGESSVQTAVSCPTNYTDVKLELVDPSFETDLQAVASAYQLTETSDNSAPPMNIISKEQPADSCTKSAIPTGLYKNVFMKPEPTASTKCSTDMDRVESAEVSDDFVLCLAICTPKSGPSSTVQEQQQQLPPPPHSAALYPSPGGHLSTNTEKMKQCCVKLKRLPDGLLSGGIFRVPRVQVSEMQESFASILKPQAPWEQRLQTQNHQNSHRRRWTTQEHKPSTCSLEDPASMARNFYERSPQKRSSLGPRPYTCNKCGKSYKTASGRWQHRKIHTGEKEHRCKVCGKMFMYKSSMTSHLRIHANIRPYPCHLCGKSFRWSSHLKVHMGRHTKDRPFICNHCGKAFKIKESLQAHVKCHTDSKLYECPDCNMKFRCKHFLKIHRRRHTGEKPYQCHLCSATFAHRNTLVVHIRAHTGERPFKCKLCPSRFSQSTHLRTHMKVHNDPEKECRRRRREQKAKALLLKEIEPCAKPQQVPKVKQPVTKAAKPDPSIPAVAKPGGQPTSGEMEVPKTSNKKSASRPSSQNPAESDPKLKSVPKRLKSEHQSAAQRKRQTHTQRHTLDKARLDPLESNPSEPLTMPVNVNESTGTRKQQAHTVHRKGNTSAKKDPFKRNSSVALSTSANAPTSGVSKPNLPSANVSHMPDEPGHCALESKLQPAHRPDPAPSSSKRAKANPPSFIKSKVDPPQPKAPEPDFPALDSLPMRVLMYRPLLLQAAQHKQSEQNDTTPRASAVVKHKKKSEAASATAMDK